MIYFIEAIGRCRIKIGFSELSVGQRLSDLQVASCDDLRLLAVVDGDRDQEALLHARFEKCRIRGEWFYATRSLVALINSHRRNAGDEEIDFADVPQLPDRGLPRSFTVKQLSIALQVDVAKILGWIARKELRALNLTETSPHLNKRPRYRILEKDLERFFINRETRAEKSSPPPSRRRPLPKDDGVIQFI